jgi:hypothetical protein
MFAGWMLSIAASGMAVVGSTSHHLPNSYLVATDRFSGYNTELALKVLPHIIPNPSEAKIRLLVRLKLLSQIPTSALKCVVT